MRLICNKCNLVFNDIDFNRIKPTPCGCRGSNPSILSDVEDKIFLQGVYKGMVQYEKSINLVENPSLTKIKFGNLSEGVIFITESGKVYKYIQNDFAKSLETDETVWIGCDTMVYIIRPSDRSREEKME